jgi:nitroreductase
VMEAIQSRRAFRSLIPVDIGPDLVADLAGCVSLSPSCFNSQPWRFVFVYDREVLNELHAALSSGNAWAKAGSMIIAVFSRPDDDCVIKSRIYHQFDTGMGVGFLILRATEMGLIAHPIAGFSPKKVREILGIPDEYQVITLIIVGKKDQGISPVLSEKQAAAEKERPERMPQKQFVFFNRFEQTS